MAARHTPLDDRSPRVAIVEEHVRHENEHNLEGVIQTFGESARYDDEPWNQHYEGREQVRQFYEQLMAALPDLSIEIVRRHVADETVILEVIIRGTQLGPWRGLPATGKRVEVPLCGVYTFGDDNRLAGERIYYDRAMILRQLGVFHEPQTALGGMTILLTHPLTILQALARRFVEISGDRSQNPYRGVNECNGDLSPVETIAHQLGTQLPVSRQSVHDSRNPLQTRILRAIMTRTDGTDLWRQTRAL